MWDMKISFKGGISLMKNTEKFTQQSKHYDVGRPSYALELLQFLFKEHLSEQDVIADIGAGTGKLTKPLLEHGNRVIAVEPNDAMRQVAQETLRDYDRAQFVKGTDSNTTLPNESIDAITVAQAFHWFDAHAFQKECKRILKPHGKVFLIWNMRDEQADINKKNFEIFQKYCVNFGGFSGGTVKNDDRIPQFFNGEYEVKAFANPLYYTKETFIKRALSASYSLQDGDEHFETYLQQLHALFDQFEQSGIVEVPNETVVYYGEIG